MKKLALLSLVGVTSIALSQAGLAAGHGGGGGGVGGGGFHGGGFRGAGFHGGGFRGGGGSHFGPMRGGPGMWGGRNWRSGDWGHHHHRFNDVIFFDDFGFPGWWDWGYPYGYYGYDYYPTITMGTPRTVTTTVTPVIDTIIGADSTPAADQGITTRAVGGQRNNFVRWPRSVAV